MEEQSRAPGGDEGERNGGGGDEADENGKDMDGGIPVNETLRERAITLAREHLELFFHGIGWDTIYRLAIEVDPELPRMVEAQMDLETWSITITVHEGWTREFESLTRDHAVLALLEEEHLIAPGDAETRHLQEISGFDTAFHVLAHDFLAGIAYHEFGHSKECPIDNERFSDILQATTTAMERAGRENPALVLYMVNLFTDLVINSIFGLDPRNAFFRNSLFLFHLSELSGSANVDPIYAYFVLLNTTIYQQAPGIRRVLENLAKDALNTDYLKRLKSLLAIFCPYPAISQKMLAGVRLDENETWTVIDHLGNKQEWGRMAYDFTRILMEIAPTEEAISIDAIPDSYFSEMFRDDTTFQKTVADYIISRKMLDRYSRRGERDGGLFPPPFLPGVLNVGGDDDEMGGTEMVDRPSIVDFLESEPEEEDDLEYDDLEYDDLEYEYEENYPGELDRHLGLFIFDDFTILDAIYRHHVKEIRVNIEREAEGQQFPVTWLNRGILDERDDPTLLDPLSVYFIPGSDDMLAFKKQVPYNIDEGHLLSEEGGFPDLALFCDDSGSMFWDPWTAVGSYDALIISVYSLFEWLKNKSFAASMMYSLTCFSTTTRTSGWVDYYHTEKLLATLFNYEGGGTRLNPDVFRGVLDTSRKKVAIIISDGEIEGTNEIISIIKEFRDEVQFLFLQIGEMSRLAKSLKKNAIPVTQIHNISEMSVVILDFLDKRYPG